jgi:hypothetical protein
MEECLDFTELRIQLLLNINRTVLAGVLLVGRSILHMSSKQAMTLEFCGPGVSTDAKILQKESKLIHCKIVQFELDFRRLFALFLITGYVCADREWTGVVGGSSLGSFFKLFTKDASVIDILQRDVAETIRQLCRCPLLALLLFLLVLETNVGTVVERRWLIGHGSI